MSNSAYAPSEAAKAASDYYNALPIEEKRKLAPLLEHYRQMGLAEAHEKVSMVVETLDRRISRIKRAHEKVSLGV